MLTQKILIVDDTPPNVLLLEKILRMNGFENLTSTVDSRVVMDIIETQQPDLVLLDLRMPYIDGFEILEQLQNSIHKEGFPVIVITAQHDPDSKRKALKLGARDFITKPFDPEEIVMRIHNTLELTVLRKKQKNRNAELEKLVAARTKELANLQIELIHRLGKAVDSRDNETGDHIIRMSLYTKEIALQLGYNQKEAELLQFASTMHDVGKIAIPDLILLKSGPLTEEEWAVMKTHTVIGARILEGSSSNLLQLAAEIALTHHEKWDGTGYPYGKKEREIPLSGCITAVADVFDALTSARPYKEPWSFEKAAAHIQEASGLHFQPEVVRAFEQALPDIRMIFSQYAEQRPAIDDFSVESLRK
ncbi:HD domain-containing phosphohydrolase [Domibacillus enclensis]|uniref:Response regulator receiver modulated metal dependent phosphohydrolase n=1 Tax=Domibacillus enclensis TaxID=1017273 RepID=A0A1N6SNF2_9BACI|nr:HD domain-containing phosphohydrolase [Domibacillus enclensis]OXS79374.1 two-component system response regulator [Domibacillus enclensis]SIQ42557.1 response regulator receiver modulated metal dependent phosphohydrolase [Domibacillus enclensis]